MYDDVTVTYHVEKPCKSFIIPIVCLEATYMVKEVRLEDKET